MDLKTLERTATELRIDILEMIYKAQSGHVGGSLSAIDVLTCLYFGKDSKDEPFMHYDVKDPRWSKRDYFILSKAHCSPAVYVTLAKAGFFPKEELNHFRQVSSLLQGHVVRTIPGVETSGGGLGQGLSIALGAALVCKREKRPNYTWCMLGDGEINGGQVWEAAMAATHLGIDNITAILDKNQVQMEGKTTDIMHMYDISAKWKAFGWHVIQIDGHNVSEIIPALEEARHFTGQPSIIISHTIKGKGGGIAEGNPSYHGKPLPKEEMEKVIPALKAYSNTLI